MPTLKFANLGVTPSGEGVSVTGGVYALATDDSTTVIVFDVRRYVVSPPDAKYEVRFKRINGFEIPILPLSRLKLGQKPPEVTCPDLGTVKQVFVVDLTGQPPAKIGWQHLRRLFPEATVSNIPLGRTDWKPVAEEGTKQRMIRAVEDTDLVERGEKVEIGPFTLFLFRSKIDGSASVLATGETYSRAFSIFFGDAALSKFFPADRVDTETVGVHRLSAGRWNAFPCHSEHSETIACQEAHS
jgi:hypothetical protein